MYRQNSILRFKWLFDGNFILVIKLINNILIHNYFIYVYERKY